MALITLTVKSAVHAGHPKPLVVYSPSKFTALASSASSEKIYLAEINVGELKTGWTLTAAQTYTYELAYLTSTIALADSTTETLRKAASSVEANGVALVALNSIAAVEAKSGSWWHDTTNSKIYIHPTSDDAPSNYTVIIYFWLYFATKGLVLNSKYYEPYIATDGIPALTQKVKSVHWGISTIGSGALSLLNGKGYFDQIYRSFIWTNKQVRILLGGSDMLYEDYIVLFTAKISQKKYTRSEITLSLKSTSFDLLKQIPTNNYWATNYANLETSAQGLPIPIYYGKYDSDQAPLVTCINTAYGASQYQFKICDHTISSITQVYIDYQDGAGWATIAHGNEDLTLATFSITSASYIVGTTKMKVAFEGKMSGTTLLEKGAHITEDILLNLCGYSVNELNSSAFATSKTLAEIDMNVPIEKATSALTIIETICKSDLAYFDEDDLGRLRYRVWTPEISGTIPVLTETDYLQGGPIIEEMIDSLYYKVKVGYSYLCSGGTYLYYTETDNPSKYKYEKEEVLLYNTYIRTSTDVVTLAQRLLWILKAPPVILHLDTKISQIQKLLGDKLKITMARAPHTIVGGYSERTFEIYEITKSAFPAKTKITAWDLQELGINVGFWTSTSIGTWLASTDSVRLVSGYWCSTAGYADPSTSPDPDSLNISKWW